MQGKTYTQLSWAEVEDALKKARYAFLRLDYYLLEAISSERSMTHKFARHLEDILSNWDVDCEFNRNGDSPKTLTLDPNDEEGSVFPDIIVHERKANNNLLVIEAKKNSSFNEHDALKIRTFMDDPGFKYAYGVILNFKTTKRGGRGIIFSQITV